MKKPTITRIASVLMMLAMLVALGIAFAFGASAEETSYTVTYTVGEGGSASVTYGENVALESGTTIAADTQVTVTVTPNTGYKATVTVGGEGVTLTDNAYTFAVAADTAIEVSFVLQQAAWGTGENNLTGAGTLQEALDAAAADDSVKYIKVMKDVDLGTDYLTVIGGDFTLDLGGKTVESTTTYYMIDINDSTNLVIDDTAGNGAIISHNSYVLKTWGGATNITVKGGTLQGKRAIYMDFENDASSLTITGGVLQGTEYAIETAVKTTITGGTFKSDVTDVYWLSGTLDLSGHSNPAGIVVKNVTGAEQTLALYNGFSFYDESGNRVDGALAYDSLYTVDVTKPAKKSQ